MRGNRKVAVSKNTVDYGSVPQMKDVSIPVYVEHPAGMNGADDHSSKDERRRDDEQVRMTAYCCGRMQKMIGVEQPDVGGKHRLNYAYGSQDIVKVEEKVPSCPSEREPTVSTKIMPAVIYTILRKMRFAVSRPLLTVFMR